MKIPAAICAFFVAGLMITSSVSAEEATYSDPAKTIDVELCKDFTITLESNKTTGFGWDIATPIDEKIIKFIGCEYIAAQTGLIGSGGMEIWSFRAVCPGKTNISFKYIRPWEKDVPPAKNLTFNVVVKEPLKDQNKQEDRCSDQR
jgi:inhibitor of cysteine peptidase